MSFDKCAARRLASISCAVACVAIVSALLAASAQGAFPGRNGRIAYVHLGGLNDRIFANRGVFSVWPGGAGARRLLDGSAGEPREAQYSPNGRRIIYTRTFELPSDHPDISVFTLRRVEVAEASGRRRTALTKGDDLFPAWAPGGQRMVFYRYPPCSRYSNAEAECPPKVLRSEKWGFLVRDREGRTHVLTHSEAFSGGAPSWSPNGRWITFVRFYENRARPVKSQPALYAIRPDGTKMRSSHTAPTSRSTGTIGPPTDAGSSSGPPTSGAAGWGSQQSDQTAQAFAG